MPETGLEDLDLEQNELEEKIEELNAVKERTADQEAELTKLRGERKKLLTTRIQHKHSELLAERNKRQELEKELQRIKSEREQPEQETTPSRSIDGIKPSVLIDGEKFYSNAQLDELVKAGGMTQAEAQEHYDSRIAAIAAERNSKKTAKQQEIQVRNEDMQKVLAEHPEFNPQHPDHNPNDPLFKEAERIFRNGYSANWKGLSLSLEEAKRILGIKASSRPDRTEDLTVTTTTTPADKTKSKKIELNKDEMDYAIKFYCYGSLKNPKTGKSFTQAEALEKALRAKEKKLGRV